MDLKIEILKPTIGAKVFLDRAAVQRPETAPELLQLLDRHTVLVFPAIGLSDAEQLALTDTLGQRVNIAAKVAGRENADEVYQVTLNEGAKIEKEYVFGTYFWHMDGMTVDIAPPKATILSARCVSVKGGQTEFASTKVAYEALSAGEKAELEGLRVVHTVTAAVREFAAPEELDVARQRLRHEHPLVATRPNGTRSLVIGYTADEIVGKSKAEGRAILMRLLEWAAQPAFTYRHQWSVGDCVIWDNTSALHRVIPYTLDSGRMMHRTSVAGVERIQ
jgi:alpha-ketoglutarate-dependent taurine dioxygenase